MRPPLRQALLMTGALVAAACSSTTMLQTWTAPGYNKKMVKKVIIFGVTPNPLIRRLYEDSFAVEIEKLGYKAVSGYLWAPDATTLDKDAIVARMKAENVTNVIVTRIIGKKELVTYTAPTVVVGVGGYGGYGGFGPAYYGSWSTYYAAGYAAVMDPGYTTVNDVLTLQTNFYDASREPDALVWSGESDTTLDQTRSGKQVPGLIQAIVYQMRAARVI